MRCRICDAKFEPSTNSVLAVEDTCPVCEGVIMEAIREMEDEEETEDEYE